ncbi:hypothetical protein P3102_15355 [Amycolatopsis sp. QT-25]|uniref:hypothetical protein n=1 Tax=Amycolatopsis sp. QT-25 TaxID=3034022 RepID=UPI0023EB67E6|nr:hypothetical protein [Amycolatopsis sp. QT-25]WET82484.1 hypothetical protein P3102_15355 [Amycolatopsis sp. QT-25]
MLSISKKAFALAALIMGGVLTATPVAGAVPTASACAVPATRDLNVSRAVYQVGVGLGVSQRVLLSGFEAGWVESHMNNLGCGDADSLGVFQQRPSQGWGTPAEIMNVNHAAVRYFQAAMNVERTHPAYRAGDIAADVQRPRADLRGRYNDAQVKATSLLSEVAGSVPPQYKMVTRYGFSNTAGVIFAKDERDGSWQTLNGGGASHWVFDGDRIGAIIGGDFLLKDGLFGGWRVMAGGGDVKTIGLHNGRIAFSNGAGIIHAKDQLDGPWHVLNPDGRTGQWLLEGNRIGAILDGNFHIKENLDEPWLLMAGGGDVRRIQLKGSRIAFSNGAGIIYAKDDRDGGWHTMNPGGHAAQWTLEGNRIGALVNGDFLFKDNIHAPWLTMAGGGDVRQIQLNGNRIAFSNSAGIIYAKDDTNGAWHTLNSGNRATEWQLEGTNIGALVNGNFLVKNGLDAPWITMTGSGDVQHIQNHDRMIQIG